MGGETASQTSASSATQHKTANAMRCKGGRDQGGVEGWREGVCRSVHHHRHLWLHPSRRPRPPRIVHCRCLSLQQNCEAARITHGICGINGPLAVINAPRKHSLTKRFIPPSKSDCVSFEVLFKMCPSRGDFSTCDEKCSKSHHQAPFAVRRGEGERAAYIKRQRA